MKISLAGENALIATFGNTINEQVLSQVRQATDLIQSELADCIVDLIPSYGSIVVIYSPRHIRYRELKLRLIELCSAIEQRPVLKGKAIEIPVYYSQESGQDLHRVAREKKLSVDELIGFHSATCYLVYAIGFAPGFAYLGELNPRLSLPRLATPRSTVPAGSVAIADRQTAVYPTDSPGGWNLIGKTPMSMFNPQNNPAMPVEIGDRIVFKAISRREYLHSGGKL